MKNLQEIDVPGPEEMKALIASLSDAERALLNDPGFITEDEADLIVSDRRIQRSHKAMSADEVLRDSGPRRRRRMA